MRGLDGLFVDFLLSQCQLEFNCEVLVFGKGGYLDLITVDTGTWNLNLCVISVFGPNLFGGVLYLEELLRKTHR